MKLLEKIEKLLVDGQEQVSPEIAAEYTDFELITKFRRIPTDDVLYGELELRGLQDEPIIRALRHGGKAGDVSWDTDSIDNYDAQKEMEV